MIDFIRFAAIGAVIAIVGFVLSGCDRQADEWRYPRRYICVNALGGTIFDEVASADNVAIEGNQLTICRRRDGHYCVKEETTRVERCTSDVVTP